MIQMGKTKQKCGYCPKIRHKMYLGCICYDCYNKKVWLNADWHEKSVDIRLKGNWRTTPILPKIHKSGDNHKFQVNIGTKNPEYNYMKKGEHNGPTN